MSDPVRVFLVDDHEVVRRGLADLLVELGGFEIVGEAASRGQALSLVALAAPHVAVLDVRLPDGSGIELCREIRTRHPRIRCLMVTAYGSDADHDAASDAGASGYLLKDATGDELAEAIRTVGRGGSLFAPRRQETGRRLG